MITFFLKLHVTHVSIKFIRFQIFVICQSWVRTPSKAPVVSLSKKHYPSTHCLVLVSSMIGFEQDFTIELRYFEDLMKD